MSIFDRFLNNITKKYNISDKKLPKELPANEDNKKLKIKYAHGMSHVRHDILNYRKLFPDYIQSKYPFINIGAGRFKHKLWTNIDFYQPSYDNLLKNNIPDIDHDLSLKLPLPIEDSSVYLAYTSHTIEHITDDMVQFLFSDIHRVLKPGGIFRIVCPDANLSWRALQHNDTAYFRNFTNVTSHQQDVLLSNRYLTKAVVHYEKFIHHVASQCLRDNKKKEAAIASIQNNSTIEDAMHSIAPLLTWENHIPNEHINWFTDNKLISMLELSGFSTIYRSRYSQSASNVLRNRHYFDKTRIDFSLYIECIK